jgi:hypothetical protein
MSRQKSGALGRKAATVKSLTDAEGRLFGLLLRPNAHSFARACREILEAAGYVDAASYIQQDDDEIAKQLPKFVSVPVRLLAAAAELLSTLPGPRRGRPRKASTNEAMRLTRKAKSIRETARLVAAITGESPEQIRSNLRSLMRRSKKADGGHHASLKKRRVKKI